MHPRLHIDPVGADTGLAGIAILRHDRPLGGSIQIGVVEDDEGCVAAQFHRHLLDRIGRGADQLLAYLGRAGEGHLADLGAFHHRTCDGARRARDDVHHARRIAHLLGQGRPCQPRIGGRGGGFGHDGAAHRQRGRNLARQHGGGEIPRRDHADHTHRVLGHKDAAAIDTGGHDLALGAAGLFGEPAHILRANGDLTHRLGQGFAHLDGQKLGQRRLIVHQRIMQLPQKPHPAHQIHRGKTGKGCGGGIDGAVGLGRAAGGNGADHLTRGGVRHINGLGAIRAHPCATDKIALTHPFLPIAHRIAPILRARSSIRQEKPHSLSYQPKTRSMPPLARLISGPCTITDSGRARRSVETRV